MDANDPATDKHIPFNYSIDNFEEGKAKCKEALQDKFGLNKDGSPVYGAQASVFPAAEGEGV